jgi:hypothetical protein
VNSGTIEVLACFLAKGATRQRFVRTLGGSAVAVALGRLGPAAEAGARSKRRRWRCIRNTPPFTAPARACVASEQCCGGGSCCEFSSDDGPGCFNLLNNQSACGIRCETAVNCINFDPPRQCVNGECVET